MLLGCDKPAPPRHIVALTGTLQSCKFETGEVVVSAVRGSVSDREPEPITCVFPRDAEIYVDDRLVTLAELHTGDAGELLGYFDPNPRLAQFVVTYASFDRQPPAAPWPPELRQLGEALERKEP